ncbi:MAG: CHAT domain-containing protein [Cyanobacteria bacterium J06560_5]
MSESRLIWAYVRHLFVALACTLLPAVVASAPSMAQVVPDSTLGAESSLVPDASETGTLPNVLIEGGAQRETTLFHSFEQFNVNPHQQVRFANPIDVENIVSRVTGGNISNIDGLLGVDGLANLFFLNPSGVIFGPNAQLDLNGAFVVSTGEQFILSEEGTFSAVDPETPPLLNLGVPVGIQLGANPQPIEANGIRVEGAPGQPLALIGGDITIADSMLRAPGGRLVLGGLAEAGTLGLNLAAKTPQSVLTSNPPEAERADISLEANNSLGNPTFLVVTDGAVTGETGGEIVLRAQNITLNESQLFAGIAGGFGSAESQAGTILLDATEDIKISNSIVFNEIEDNALGRGGDIRLSAENIELFNARLNTEGLPAESSAGDIELRANNRIIGTTDEFSFATITSGVFGRPIGGPPGNITLTAPQIRLEDGVIFETIAFDGPEAGRITLDAESLEVLEDSEITTFVEGTGRGGDIRVRATDILLDGRNGEPFFASLGVSTSVGFVSPGGGRGGDVTVDTQNLTIIGSLVGADVFADNSTGGSVTIRATDTVRLVGDAAAEADGFIGGGQITSAIRGRAEEDASTGGDISIEARRLILENGSLIDAAAAGAGNSGNIVIRAEEEVTLRGQLEGIPSRIVTQLQNPLTGASGGDITIETGQLNVLDAAQISAATLGAGPGGNIRVEASQGVVLSGSTPRVILPFVEAESPFVFNASETQFPGGIFADSTANFFNDDTLVDEQFTATGNAGDIEIVTSRLELSDRAQISVNSANAGTAGNLTIRANTVSLDNALVSAETIEGNDANINLLVQETVQLRNASSISTNAAGSASGGNLLITNPNAILLRDRSVLSAENSGGTGDGGNITLNTGSLVAAPDGQNRIVADAFGGDGGRVDITTNTLVGDPFIDISASSEFGLEGTVEINALNEDFDRDTVQLPENLQDRSDQIVDACAVDRQGQAQFMATGRGGLPPTPTSLPMGMILLGSDDKANNEASLHLAQGDARTAISLWQQVIERHQQNNNALGQRQAQLNQIQALQSLGFYPQAQTQLEAILIALSDQSTQSLVTDNLVAVSEAEAVARLNLGNVLRVGGEGERSQQMLETALAISQSLDHPLLTSTVLLNLGHTAQANNHTERALAFYQRAIETAPTSLAYVQAEISQLALHLDQAPTGVSDNAAERWLQLQQQLAALPATRAATYAQLHLAQLELNSQQALASPNTVLALLTTASQQAKTLNDSVAETYALAYQGQFYRQTQQWPESQTLTEKALENAQRLEAPEIVYELAWQLGRFYTMQGNQPDAIAAYNTAIEALSMLRGELAAASTDVQFTFRDGVEPVYREFVKLLLQSKPGQPVEQANLKQARSLIEALQLAELNDYFQDACVRSSPVAADEIDPTAAIIYPILLDDRLDVIVSVADAPIRHYSTPLDPQQLENTTRELLTALTTPLGAQRVETTQQLQQVYDWVFRPIAADLAQQSIETLVFVADGPLRTLPLNALHDGKQYLIESYNVVLSPGLNLLDPRPLERQSLRMLAAGLSESRPGFPALPFVNNELQNVTTQLPNNQLLFNQSLTKENLIHHLTKTEADVVHLATHGEFGSSAEDTFILTWEGKMTLKEMGSVLQARHRSSVSPIELLVLSACKTATGDSRSVLGIAGMAIRSEVRSALAGLWPLNDQATATFMTHFYEALAQPETTKADALRQAQLALLAEEPFNSPYYWSPFVLVGNWL